MAKEFKYLCQVYMQNSKGQLVIDQTIECRSELAAEMRAEKIWQSGNYAGVDALLIGADPEQGDYDAPVFITRLGNVPDEE
ncbi:MAG: hypothetical protein HQ483_12385 [Rhodospirillales bacterium]|nr:hypothetical protein [Rhodospirillales bacterium]